MAKVNAKIFALKYKLMKKLETSLNKDKELIKEGAEITFKNYCKIQIVETHYKRIDIDNIPIEIDQKVNDIFNTLEDSQDKDIKRVASKVANKRK